MKQGMEEQPVTAASYPVPDPDHLAGVMSDLLGKEVNARLGKPLALRSGTPMVLALFRDEQGKVREVVTCDIMLAAYIGAALALLPSDVDLQVIKEQKLPDNLLDNFREVLNVVGGTLFNSSDTPQLILDEVITVPQRLPAELKPILTRPGNWLFVDVNLEDYGDGKMAVLAAPL